MKNKKDYNVEELANDYKRAVADYRNLKRRSEEEKEKIIKLANERLILNMLEVLDDLEESLKHLDNAEGVDKVVEKFISKLENEGLDVIDPKDKDFNPNEHEALEITDGKKGKVMKVYRKGYKLFDKVVRPALVAVGK